MPNIHSYLSFSGNCREAMLFYQSCLGGELVFQTIGESPMAEKMPAQMKELILQATLTHRNMVLMGSDMVSDEGLIHGNAVSLSLTCSSEEEIRKCYTMLSASGKATHPLEVTFWGALSGDLIDKYGNNWILHYNQSLSSAE